MLISVDKHYFDNYKIFNGDLSNIFQNTTNFDCYTQHNGMIFDKHSQQKEQTKKENCASKLDL